MDADFEKMKRETETDLGRPIDGEEEHHLKLLHYFGKGVKLKAQLDSEPERIGPIVERRFAELVAQGERQRQQGRVVEAVQDFLAGQRNPAKRHRLKARAKNVRE